MILSSVSVNLSRRILSITGGVFLGVALSALFSGCTVDSADSVIRSVGANVAGFYQHDGSSENGGKFVSANSGAAVTSLDLRQSGDQLEAIDNNGLIFRGTVGAVVDSFASFNLEGVTTIGNSVIISGNIQIGGGQGVMRATWIEDTLYSTVYGVANGPSIITPDNPGIVTNIVNNSKPTIVLDPAGTTKPLPINTTNDFSVTADSVDAGQSISLSASALPTGATFANKTDTKSVTSVFTWSPTSIGTNVVTFTATDADGTTTLAVTLISTP